MSNPGVGLDMVAFTWTPNASGSPAAVVDLAYLRAFAMSAENDQKDGSGVGDRYEFMMNVKQGQPMDFTVFVKGSGVEPLTNLDITLYSIGGTAYLGSVRGGSIEATTTYKEGSGIASAYKYPVAAKTKVIVLTKKLVLTDVSFLSTLLTGAVSTFDVTASITFGGSAFSMPMTLRSAKHTIDREETQFEDVILTPKGAPTGPADNSLLGNVLLGTSQVALAVDTGHGQYNTAEAAWALITKLTTKFEDANCIEQSGQFQFQGPATYVAD
jgi:hypothetical protein